MGAEAAQCTAASPRGGSFKAEGDLGQPVTPRPVTERLNDTIDIRALKLENIPTVRSTGTALVWTNGLKALLRVIYVKYSHILGALCELSVQRSRFKWFIQVTPLKILSCMPHASYWLEYLTLSDPEQVLVRNFYTEHFI